MEAPICPYCGNPSCLVGGDTIYPHRPDLHEKKFYSCASCDAYVGCHWDGATPLGRLADEELRKAKSTAHAIFDPLWKSRKISRGMAYGWLAKTMGIPKSKCHIGMFDVDQCNKVVYLVQKHHHKRRIKEPKDELARMRVQKR